ncbi:hypothetical protein [Streptomyces longwoodensis]|uniref:hypothetical protein n=1 Tax=Streptomyces longwoodensis TaxID=68231 RepID=UPI0030E03BC4
MFDRVREGWARLLHAPRGQARSAAGGRAGDGGGAGAGRTGAAGRRAPNLFEAAAAYVSARVEDDQEGIDEAAGWVTPETLSFGTSELACRAVVALARERDESPRTVARALLGLPNG